MSNQSTNSAKRGILLSVLLVALLIWVGPTTFADPGHIGGKPDIGQGDGIPQTKPGTIRSGEQNQDGDASQGDDPAQDGGDGIPNEGPIEGGDHSGQGYFGTGSVSTFLWVLLNL